MSHLRNRLSYYWNWVDDDEHVLTVLIGLLVMGFVLRLSTALIIPIDYRLRKDAVSYLSLAQQLLDLGVYGLDPGVPDARIPPGYPFFLSGILAASGQSLIAVRLVQAFLGTVTIWLTFLVGKEAFSDRSGLVGAFLLAVYPVWVVWPVLILTETLFTLFLMIFALYLLRAMRTCFNKYAIGSSVSFSLALLTREALYGLPLVLPLALLWSQIRWRDALRYVLLFFFTMLLILLPWLVRNYITLGHLFYTEGSAYTRYRVIPIVSRSDLL